MAQQLQDIISRISALEQANIPPAETDLSDPPIYFTNEDGSPVSAESIEKLPDLIKDLPTFSGDPNEVSVWIDDAEGLVKLYQPRANSSINDKNKFHVICKAIRRKIKGEANDALVASNVNINWYSIKKTLLTYYGEKRDIVTLDYQLMNASQRGRPIEEYYDEVNKLLSLIANQIKTDMRYMHPEASRAMLENFNDKAIDSFMRGLDGDLGKFLKNYRPESLAQAFSYCISFQNIEYRKTLTRNRPLETNLPVIRNQIPPRIPNKPIHFQKPFIQPNWTPPPRNYFPPKPPQFLQNRPNIQTNPFNKPIPPRFPPRNPFQKQDKPEPMEVDQSLRTRQINYANRPPVNKRPRNFNITTDSQNNPEYIDHDPESQTYFEYMNNELDNNTEETETFERYMRNIEKQDPEQETDNVELNFLE